MSSPDRQFVALAGQPNGELWLVDYRQPAGHTHKLLRPKDDFTPVRLDLGDIVPPDGVDYADALKVSGALFVDLVVGRLGGGSEDCVDVNHSHSIGLRVARFEPRGRYVATIKGGSSNITVKFGAIEEKPRYVDFDLGNWSDQSRERTTQVHIEATGRQPRRYTVRQLHAKRPTLRGDFKLSAWLSPFFQPLYTVLKTLRLA
jgi:hypothetical protein